MLVFSPVLHNGGESAPMPQLYCSYSEHISSVTIVLMGFVYGKAVIIQSVHDEDLTEHNGILSIAALNISQTNKNVK